MTQRDNIVVEGHIGTWYIIDEREVMDKKVYLLEHETFGDSAACVVIDEQGELLADEIWNGLDEFENERCFIEVPIFSEEPNQDGFYDLIGYRKEFIK